MGCCGFSGGGGGGIPGVTVPAWEKLSVVHTQFQTAALSNTILLYTLPAAGLVHGLKLKTTAAFAGAGISSYFLSIGFSGFPQALLIEYPVTPAVGPTEFAISSLFDSRNHDVTVPIQITARAVGANLSASTAGAADIWLLLSRPD